MVFFCFVYSGTSVKRLLVESPEIAPHIYCKFDVLSERGNRLDFPTICVRRRRTLSNHVVSSRGIDHVPRVSIAMPVDFRVWTPSWTGTLSLDSIWTGTCSLDSMYDHCLLKNHTISLAFKTFSYTE